MESSQLLTAEPALAPAAADPAGRRRLARASGLLAALLVIGLLPLLAAVFWRRLAAAALLLYAIAVPISRLVLGVHYPTDVVGGVLLGTGWTLVCAAVLLRDGTPARQPSRTGLVS